MDPVNYQHSFWMQSGTTFFDNDKCLPDQGNVGYHTKKFTETGLDLFIKYI